MQLGTSACILDATFDGDGHAVYALGNDYSCGFAICQLTNGDLLVCGTKTVDSSLRMVVLKLSSNGSRINAFGVNGVKEIVVGGFIDIARAMCMQENGKILVAGGSDHVSGGANTDFALVRLNTNVTLDNTFVMMV